MSCIFRYFFRITFFNFNFALRVPFRSTNFSFFYFFFAFFVCLLKRKLSLCDISRVSSLHLSFSHVFATQCSHERIRRTFAPCVSGNFSLVRMAIKRYGFGTALPSAFVFWKRYLKEERQMNELIWDALSHTHALIWKEVFPSKQM